jgi:V/A-type H+-transporting ATPase subunit K
MRRLPRILLWGNAALIAVAGASLVLLVAWNTGAEEARQAGEATASPTFVNGLFSAALATGLSALGAGYAIAHVGAASVGAMSERPEIAGRTLIVVGLAEGIAIYGLITSVLILGRL